MRLKLIRDEFEEDCTLGKLYNGEHFCCYTLEDKVREISLPVERWKIPGMTAIPRGKYRVMLTFSNRFQKYLPELQDVPGFKGIRIHAGNTSEDTEGCILVGMGRGKGVIYESRKALAALQQQIENAIRDGDKVWIDIS
jgi:hypothetical protein